VGAREQERLVDRGRGRDHADATALEQRARRPDLALVDVQLRGESGVELARKLSEELHAPAVILVSMRDEDDLVELIEAAPVNGFIPKHRLSAQSIQQVLAGT
jgi:DNA-binding NarL/FixJ family response regulator